MTLRLRPHPSPPAQKAAATATGASSNCPGPDAAARTAAGAGGAAEPAPRQSCTSSSVTSVRPRRRPAPAPSCAKRCRAQAIDLKLAAQPADEQPACRRRGRRAAAARAPRRSARATLSCSASQRAAKATGSASIRQPAADDFGPHRWIARPDHLHHQAEAVEQLRPQIALLAGSSCRSAGTGPGASTDTPSRCTVLTPSRRGVEQHIDEMIRQQIHLVDVQDAAVRRWPAGPAERPAGPRAGRARSRACPAPGPRSPPAADRRTAPAFPPTRRSRCRCAVRAVRPRRRRVAAERAALHDCAAAAAGRRRRGRRCSWPCPSRRGSARRRCRVNGVEQQGRLELLLTDQCGEGIFHQS